MKWGWVALGIGVAAAVWFYRYPYATGMLLKYPDELNAAAKQLNDASSALSGASGLISDLKSDWNSIESAL